MGCRIAVGHLYPLATALEARLSGARLHQRQAASELSACQAAVYLGGDHSGSSVLLPCARGRTIIREGMGSQFDPALEPVYLAARPELEAYYSSLEQNN